MSQKNNAWMQENAENDKQKNIDTAINNLEEKVGKLSLIGIKEETLHQGFKVIRSTKLFDECLDICFCDNIQEYLILDRKKTIHRYSIDGILIPPVYKLDSQMLFTKIVWCEEIEIFICYIPDMDLIWILTNKFKLIQKFRNDFKIEKIFYAAVSNELIVIGQNNATKYLMEELNRLFVSYDSINFSDKNYGPAWAIQCSSLISIDPSFLKLVGSYSTSIYIIPLNPNEDADRGIPIEFIGKKLKPTIAPISSLLFDSRTRWIIVGDVAGSVFAWTLNFENMMRCLSGHKSKIQLIVSHPTLRGFITWGKDCLQVWNSNVKTKVESFSTLGKISSIAINKKAACIATLGTKLSFLYMNQLYVFFSRLLAPANVLLSIKSHIHPTRLIVCSTDGIIRMMSPTANKLSRGIFSPEMTPMSMAYSAVTGRLYVIPSTNEEILAYDVKEFPIILRKSWPSVRKITCITVYDRFEEQIDLNNVKTIKPVCTRIIIGTSLGKIGSLDDTTGTYTFLINAHKGPITKIHASTVTKHVFSIGEDKCLKIWRMFSKFGTFLIFINCVYYTIPLTNLASIGYAVCVVSSAADTITHQLEMHNFRTKTSYQHSLWEGHDEEILDIATSESLLICATSSRDNTIRIWDQENYLLKIIEMGIPIQTIAFSSLRGDIVFNMGTSLYRIPYENYLSPEYRSIIKTNDITKEQKESPMPKRAYNFNTYATDSTEPEVLRPISSDSLAIVDPPTDIPDYHLVMKEQTCTKLKIRDEDIVKIKDRFPRQGKKAYRKALINEDEASGYTTKLSIWDDVYDDKEPIPRHDIWKIKENYSQLRKVPHKNNLIPAFFEYDTHGIDKNRKLSKKIDIKNFVGFIPNSLIVREENEEIQSDVSSHEALKKNSDRKNRET